MKKQSFRQIGFVGLRDPKTREIVKTVRLYVEDDQEFAKAEEDALMNVGRAFAEKYKQYLDGCKQGCSDAQTETP